MGMAAARLLIDLDAVVTNWQVLRSQAGGAHCAAVVKADAYGLGASPIAGRLFEEGCRTFFVAQLEEGIALRTRLPAPAVMFVLNGLIPGTESDCVDAGLWPVLNSLGQVEAWQKEARRRQVRLAAALQVDTGMHRLGLPGAEWQALIDHPDLLDGIDLRLVMSHLVNAERIQAVSNRRQLQQFVRMRSAWPTVPASLANSSGIFLGAPWHFDLVRPGAALYGIAPQMTLQHAMHPVVQLQARIIQCRDVVPGGRVGYNGTWRAARQSRIATVAAGYADGFPRALGNRASAAVAGHVVPVIGRVSMDTLTVDVTDVPPSLLAQAGWCDLLDSVRTVNVQASAAGISPYTLLTGLGQRLQRVWTVKRVPSQTAAQPALCPA